MPTENRFSAEARAVQLTQDRKMRVYIAGPMTGLPEFNFPAFNAAAAQMRAEGWHVENPADHGHVHGAEWADYLRYDITRLATCEMIMLLPGWSKSKGANLEVTIARQLGMPIKLAEGAESADSPSSEAPNLRAQLKIARTALDNIMHATDNSQQDGAHHENAYSLAEHALNNMSAACQHHNVAPRSTITDGKLLGYFCKECGALSRTS